jgi:hypothetical protein
MVSRESEAAAAADAADAPKPVEKTQKAPAQNAAAQTRENIPYS